MATLRELERKAIAARKKSDKLVATAISLLAEAKRVREEVRSLIDVEIAKLKLQKACREAIDKTRNGAEKQNA